jgi:hypothetical protein
MHWVQTLTLFTPSDVWTRTFWRFGSQVFLVLFWAWDTLCPVWGPLPHISHFLDIELNSLSVLLQQ